MHVGTVTSTGHQLTHTTTEMLEGGDTIMCMWAVASTGHQLTHTTTEMLDRIKCPFVLATITVSVVHILH